MNTPQITNEQTKQTRERPTVTADVVETQHGPEGEQVFVFRVIRKRSPGRVTYDIAQAAPVRRTKEGIRTRGEARRLAMKWAQEGAK